MTTTQLAEDDQMASGAPIVVVSSDTHIGPLLDEQLRPLCPTRHLEAFDEFARQVAAMHEMMAGVDLGQLAWNQQTEGHHDVTARLQDMDRDGVAAEVIFHGSQNFQPIPFQSFGPFLGYETGERLELLAVGYRIYNEWLAEFVSHEPHRHVGLAHLPMWDIDDAVRELQWAAEAGLRGVNFPAPKPFILPYNRPEWEPFWEACEALGMTLANHGGAGNPQGADGPGGQEIMISDLSALSRVSPMNQLVFSGVFERFPRLRLVLTELPGTWWAYTLNELDSIHLLQMRTGRHDPTLLTRLPSEYCTTNVFVGASFQSRHEAIAAIEQGYSGNVLWGSDYPHVEGTWQFPRDGEEESMTLRAMRASFAGLDHGAVRNMLGLNAVEAFGLDGELLAAEAARIDAPTPGLVDRPLGEVPEEGGYLAFRTVGPWA